MKFDILIIGGGAIGCFIAYHLRQMRDCNVAVVERDPTYALASTPRAAGGVRRLFALPENIDMSNYSIPIFEAFGTLMAVNGEAPDIGFRKNGYVFVVPPAQMPVLERNMERQAARGVKAALLDQKGIRQLFPSMNVDDLGGAVHSPEDGWLDPYGMLQALKRKTRDLGVTFIDDDVVDLTVEGNLVREARLASGRTVSFDIAVNAAGAWAKQICEMVGWRVPIEPMKRYEHYFECTGTIEPLPYFKDLNRLAFRPEGQGYTGGVPTLKQPRGYDFEIDHTYFERVVWPALAERFPQFEATREKNVMSGLYDQNEIDGNPILGRWGDRLENFYLAAGFSGHGLMHAPATGRAVAELIHHGHYVSLDLSRLGWDRVENNQPYAEEGII